MLVVFEVLSIEPAQPAAWLSARPSGKPEDDVARECLAWQGQHHRATSALRTLAR